MSLFIITGTQAVAKVLAKDGSAAVTVAVLHAAYTTLQDASLDLESHARNVVRLVVLHCLRLEREAVHSNSPWSASDMQVGRSMPALACC